MSVAKIAVRHPTPAPGWASHEHVPLMVPTFPEPAVIAADYAGIVKRGWYSNSGPLDRELAARVERWVGGGVSATTTSNCTAAIELAVRTLFLDRPLALVASFTFAAGPQVLVNAGYQLRFLDIDSWSLQPSVEHARALLNRSSEQVAGILLTATFGVANAEIDAWESLAHEFAIPLVIDSAAGFGATYQNGEPLGARGNCEVFSMHATKLFAAGEGGLITSRDAELIERVDTAKNFGFDATHAACGWGMNAKLPELTAAIALRQLEMLPERLVLRRAVLGAYDEILSPYGVRLQPNARTAAPPFTSVLMPTAQVCETVSRALASVNIEHRRYYTPPIHRHPWFAARFGECDLPATEDVCARVLSLPMADDLDLGVISAIARITEAAIDY